MEDAVKVQSCNIIVIITLLKVVTTQIYDWMN